MFYRTRRREVFTQAAWLVVFEFSTIGTRICGASSALGKTAAVFLVPISASAILDGMRDIFACSKCRSIYEITRLKHQPTLPPRCQVCFASFPFSELGDWLVYERAEPEWTVGEWLTGETSQFSLPSPHQTLARLAHRKIPSADPTLPSSRLPKLSAFSHPSVFDER